MVGTAQRQALRTLPKAELHLHIEGTLEPELAMKLAQRNNIDLPWHTVEELEREYQFENLQSFLDLYYQLMQTLRTADDFRDLMLAYLERAHNNGVMHAEIFFDPKCTCSPTTSTTTPCSTACVRGCASGGNAMASAEVSF